MSVTGWAGFRAACGRLARMAAPLTLYGLVQVFVTANDALLLGTAGATAITSAAAAGSLTMVAVMFFAGLGGTAGQILVARAWGASDADAARLVVERALRLILAIALPLLIGIGLGAPWLLRVIGGAATDAQLATAMLWICLPGVLFSALGVVLRGYATGIGETRVVMTASIFSATVDIAGSVALLAAGVGPLGVSIGSAAGMAAATLTLAGWLARRHRAGEPVPRWRTLLVPVDRTSAEVWRIGWPEALLGVFSAGAAVVVTVLLSRSSPSELAAARVVEATTTLAWTALNGIGTAGLSLLAQALGAGRRKEFRQGVLAMIALGSAVAVVLLIAGPTLTGWYLATTFEPDVVRTAQPILLLAWAQVAWILCSIVLLGICRSHKDTRASLRASLIAEYLIFLPVGWLLCRHWTFGVQGLFVTHHAFWLAFCAILAISAVRHLRSDDHR